MGTNRNDYVDQKLEELEERIMYLESEVSRLEADKQKKFDIISTNPNITIWDNRSAGDIIQIDTIGKPMMDFEKVELNNLIEFKKLMGKYILDNVKQK